MTEGTLAYLREEMKKAEHSLTAAQKLIEENLMDDAISRAYYAVFHSARAALKTKGIETTTSERGAEQSEEKRRYVGASATRVPDPERDGRSGARRAASPTSPTVFFYLKVTRGFLCHLII